MDEIELLFNKKNITNNNETKILRECKISKRLIKTLLDKINFKLPIFIFYVDIEKIYKEYQKMSDFNTTEDQFVYKQLSHSIKNIINDLKEIVKFNNFYCKDSIKKYFFDYKKIIKQQTNKKQNIKESILDTTNINKKNYPIKTSLDIAREVINGEWGNGRDRIIKLSKAGYDYVKVQYEVNNLLGYPLRSNIK